MALYEEVISDIEEKKKNKEAGKHNAIPWPFPRHSEYFDSIEKGTYIGLLGATGSSKSRFSRFLIYNMVEFSIRENYPIKVLYFGLEDEKKAIYRKVITHYLYTRHGIDVGQKYLNSKDVPLPDKYLDIIKKDAPFWKEFEKRVWIINDATSPNEIHTKCEEVYEKYGKTHHLVAIVDNFANITKDTHDNTEYEAVKRLSRNIIRLRLCKVLNMSVLAILQQDYESERNSFRNTGKPITTIEPNLSSVGDMKICTRDMFAVFAIFDPFRYDLKNYPNSDGYNIEILRNKAKFLLMLKANEYAMAPRLGMYFDGQRELFEELPLPADKAALDSLYVKIMQEEKEKYERVRAHQTKIW